MVENEKAQGFALFSQCAKTAKACAFVSVL